MFVFLKFPISSIWRTTSSLLNQHKLNMMFEVFGGEFFRLGNKRGRSSRWESIRKIRSTLRISVTFRIDNREKKKKKINSFQHSGLYARPFRLAPAELNVISPLLVFKAHNFHLVSVVVALLLNNWTCNEKRKTLKRGYLPGWRANFQLDKER